MKELIRPVDHDKGSHGLPGIFFKYDISPIKVNVKQERDNIFTFVVRLFATIGGIHAAAGILNSIINFVTKSNYKRLQEMTS